MMQISYTAACNRLHAVEQRLARWLLMIHERVHKDALDLTHEFIAEMLGAGRASVTLAAGILQKAGLIHYSRGHITIVSREGLELVTCDCYAKSRAEFERVGLGLERDSQISLSPVIKIKAFAARRNL
jgi:hypothetical protein